ncbi:hypothetical protein [Nesterenkonia lutea]|uniref:WGR domain-containing protein n=1 Tax=Nesterenkonia lutea TaxID=272919 RepID=A0ABR9JCY4_9MICC|nr:hypothetical protein [Nesterenkonia lutea]MBE1523793.1 hypothetical protein [Nesterenkonia lutea]
MITLYRREDQAWTYREAWYDDDAQELVIHRGTLGANGKIATEKAAPEESEQLLQSFLAQCEQDGYHEAPTESLTELRLVYPLKAEQPSSSEERNINTVHRDVLGVLAWRGLGALGEPEVESDGNGHASVMRVKTLHQGKAREAVKSAVRGGDVPASKVELRVG